MRREDLGPAAATLARAFEADPIFSKVFEGVRPEKMEVWLQGPVLYGALAVLQSQRTRVALRSQTQS